MKNNYDLSGFTNCLIVFLILIGSFLSAQNLSANEEPYPVKVQVINKDQAKYDTPENSLFALKSALKKGDLEWAYNSLTLESSDKLKSLHLKAGLGESEIIEFEGVIVSSFILKKFSYQDAVILIVEDHDNDRSVTTMPLSFVLEEGEWKMTNKFSGDEVINEYIEFVGPEDMLTATINFTPNRWNINWYEYIKDKWNSEEWKSHKQFQNYVNNLSVLCLIVSLQDDQGSNLDINHIVPESILLNHIVLPQTWENQNGNTHAVIIDDFSEMKLSEIKGYEPLQRAKPYLSNRQGPVMIVKFNKFESIATLSDASPGQEKVISISGKLKDGRRFDSEVNVHIIGWPEKHR